MHIKSMKEYDILQDVIILFSETTQRFVTVVKNSLINKNNYIYIYIYIPLVMQLPSIPNRLVLSNL